VRFLFVAAILAFESVLTYYLATTPFTAGSAVAFACWTAFVISILFIFAKDNA
jgi:hypothetical protein